MASPAEPSRRVWRKHATKEEGLKTALVGLDAAMAASYRTGVDAGREAVIQDAIAGIKNPGRRARIEAALRLNIPAAVDAIHAEFQTESDELEAKIATLGVERSRIGRLIAATDDLTAWLGRPLVLQSVDVSVLHKISDSTIILGRLDDGEAPGVDQWMEGGEVFLVQHDWASIIGEAQVDSGEVRLPFERVCFEFGISGRRVCAVFFSVDGEPHSLNLFIQSGAGWFYSGAYEPDGERWAPAREREKAAGDIMRPVAALVGAQVRAIAITLDAMVVASTVVRAPHALNAARIKRGETPIFDHHILTLSRTPRATPLERAGAPARHKRLHFRRGHWRHFQTHKTWIRWMLVGDPSLGFADKDYRL